MKRPATISDVAREARVSRAAAARALGGYGSVSAELRVRIAEAARRLDYRPNELARTMATGRSGTIGVVVGDIENPFFGLAVRGISDHAGENGFNVVLCNSGEDIAAERAAVQTLVSKRVDGLVVAPAAMLEAAHLRDAQARGCPLVLLDRDVPGLAADSALVDSRKAASVATDFLISAGHQRIGYVTATTATEVRYKGPEQIALSTVLDRISGFLETSHEAGLADAGRYIRLGAVHGPTARSVISELLSDPIRPTALIASDSMIALDVFRATRSLGMLVPSDLSLVAFDDADWTSAVSPTVTVMAQPSYDLGVAAASMLLDRIAGLQGAPRRRCLDAAMIGRESVKRLTTPHVQRRNQ